MRFHIPSDSEQLYVLTKDVKISYTWLNAASIKKLAKHGINPKPYVWGQPTFTLDLPAGTIFKIPNYTPFGGSGKIQIKQHENKVYNSVIGWVVNMNEFLHSIDFEYFTV